MYAPHGSSPVFSIVVLLSSGQPKAGKYIPVRAHPKRSILQQDLSLKKSRAPGGIARELSALEASEAKGTPQPQPSLPHLYLPAHHDVRATDVNARRLY